jgi:hypothetical protein
VFFIAAGVYVVCNTIYLIFASAKLQPWDNLPEKPKKKKTDVEETQA